MQGVEQLNKNSNKPKYLAFAVIIITIAATAVAVYQISYGKKNAAPAGGRGGGTVVPVKTQKLQVETLHGYISTNGEVESRNSVSVFPDVSGKIISTRVMLGSTVRKGEIIAYVDPNVPGEYYRQSPVYAPISGSIITKPLENGTTVNTNTAIAIIGDINNLQVTASVPERFVSVLKTGLKAHVSVEAYPDVVFPAKVSRVSPVVDSKSRTKDIVLLFDERDSRVNAGMFAKVVLFTEDYAGEIVMPLNSLVQNGDKYYAFTVNGDSTVTKREVTIGKAVDGIVQITSGLVAGERVVVQGQTSLADGSKIQDLSQESASGESNEHK